MLLSELWNFDRTKSPALFYGGLKDLNNFYNTTNASPEILKAIQIKELKSAYATKGNAYNQLNNFLHTMMSDKQGTEDDLFAKLVQGINKGLDEFTSAKNKKDPNWNKTKYYEELDNIIQQITQLANNAAGTDGIPAPSIDTIKHAVGYHNYHDFIQAKGQYLEDLGTWIMNMAGLTGFSTGSWQAIDKFFGEKAQSSIIEDAMGLLLDGTQKLKGNNNFLSVQIQNYNRKSTLEKSQADAELQEWVSSIKELNGAHVLNGRVTIGSNIDSPEKFANLMRLINKNISSAKGNLSISLSDNLYQQIQKLTVNIQGKSNIERHLANKGNRSLYRINPSDRYYSQLKTFSTMQPVVNGTAVTIEEQNTPYEEFSAYVNYNLSKNINNTVYGRNEFYLTVEGFTDLATLMEKRDFYIRIKDSFLSYKQFLDNSFRTIYQ